LGKIVTRRDLVSSSYQRKGKMGRVRRVVLTMLILIAILFAGLCGVLFVFQRSLIYFPQPRSYQHGMTLTTLEVGTGTVLVSTLPNTGSDALIYFGGNAEDVSRNMPDFSQAFPNYAIYLLHYPGYGGSSGSPSEQAIIADALALFDHVYAEHKNIVVVGRSLGSGVAVRLASMRPVERLVLVTPYDSLGDVAARNYPFLPARWLLRDKFESWKYAPRVTAPTRIIAAEQDEVIPRTSTDRLRTRFKNGIVSYVVVPGVGHNTISDSADYLSLLKNK
jgi:pimeloyl-ACP methyl ester carboxylesterase